MVTKTLPGRLCPYAAGYDYPCDDHDCDNCDMAKEARAKAEERADAEDARWSPAQVHLRNILGVRDC